ncbi:hypothetical protein C1J03_09035 [Sulfitobacter sp. SK012]|uniref:hypothetical protein n=1 Tax=Sulfitobacter sp. SK012 TaxID=1389005 RepID=UPI000E0B07CB|nr:hypothetical protein [Sulfitobacter sp. SK012]AXI46151.1 hypothetical protein C1J03_09035 [Sulfitobacter sp. SK012]
MASYIKYANYEWSNAKGLIPATAPNQKGLQGALVPDSNHNCDHVAVVYDRGDTPPEITIKETSGMVHTVLANGVAIAVIARSTGAALNPADVLLVERSVHT